MFWTEIFWTEIFWTEIFWTEIFWTETFGLARAPVVEHRKVIGVIGYTDIVLLGLVKHL